MLKGKSRDIGLGAAGQGGISLADARTARDALRLKVKAGIDPLEERQREATEALAAAQAAGIARVAFKAVAEAYLGSWRNDKHRQHWRNTLASYVYPVMGELPVADISTVHVLKVLEPIWQDRPETASRIRGRIETVLDAAKARIPGRRKPWPLAQPYRANLAAPFTAHARAPQGHAVRGIRAFMETLRERKATAALALEFVVLTATRTSEVLGAT